MTRSYMVQPAEAMRQVPSLMPDEGGIYAMLLDHPTALEPSLKRAGLRLDPVFLGRRAVLYIGATDDSLRRRLKHHLSDDTCRSTFRMSLGAVLADDLGLVARPIPGQRYFGFERDSERLLSKWIGDHVSVALRPQSRARETEAGLIMQTQPPLNIAGRRDDAATGVMMMLRRRCRGLSFDPRTLH